MLQTKHLLEKLPIYLSQIQMQTPEVQVIVV